MARYVKRYTSTGSVREEVEAKVIKMVGHYIDDREGGPVPVPSDLYLEGGEVVVLSDTYGETYPKAGDYVMWTETGKVNVMAGDYFRAWFELKG